MVVSSEVITITGSVVSYGNDHLIKFWSNLDATGQSAEGMGCWSCSFQGSCFSTWLLIKLFEMWITDHNVALAAWYTHAIVIVRNLIWFKSMFLFTSFAIWKNTRCVVSLNDIQKWFTWIASISSWDTIWRNDINPNDLFCNLYSTAFNSWSQSLRTKWTSHHERWLFQKFTWNKSAQHFFSFD